MPNTTPKPLSKWLKDWLTGKSGLVGKGSWQGDPLLSEEIPETPRAAAILAGKLFAMGRPQDAARTLAQAGLFMEAAHIMKRTGNVKVAAHYYCVAKAWDLAEGCYWVLGDRVSAARCIFAAGHIEKAAKLFEESGQWSLAAEAYQRLGVRRKAADLYFKDNRFAEVVQAYGEWLKIEGERRADPVTEVELDQIVVSLSRGPDDKALVSLVERHGRSRSLVFGLTENGGIARAAKIYASHADLMGPIVVEWAKANQKRAELAQELAGMAGDLTTQARILEMIGRQADALDAHQAAGNLERALELATTLRDPARIETIQGLIVSRGRQSPGTSRATNAGAAGTRHSMMSQVKSFAMTDVTGEIAVTDTEAVPQAFAPMAMPSFSESRLFQRLVPSDRERLWSLGGVTSYAEDMTIIDFGETPAGAFTLLTGTADIYRQRDDGTVLVDTIKAGQNFGESWILTDKQSSVRIVASCDCQVHLVQRTSLETVIASGEAGATSLFKNLTESVLSHLMISMSSTAQAAA